MEYKYKRLSMMLPIIDEKQTMNVQFVLQDRLKEQKMKQNKSSVLPDKKRD